MAIRGSEVSADYVSALRGRNYSWSTIARITGAAEIDLRRYHGGDVAVPTAGAAAKPQVPIYIERTPVAVPRQASAASKVNKTAQKSKSKPRRSRRPLTQADNRLVALLVATGMGLDAAIIFARLYRAADQRLCMGELVGCKVADADAVAQMAGAAAAGKSLGLGFRRSPKGFKLNEGSIAFLAQLLAVGQRAA